MARQTFRLALLTAALLATPTLATASDELVASTTPTLDAFGLPSEVVIAPRATGRARPARKAAKVRRTASTEDTHGASFGLDRVSMTSHENTMPTGDAEMQMTGLSLSAGAVGAVIRDHKNDLEYCMTRLPTGTQDQDVGLALTIERNGKASAVALVGGPTAAAFSKCMVGSIKRWSFPTADGPTQLEYPLRLRGR